MRTNDIGEVRQLSLFRSCGEATFESLIRAGFLQRFPRGVILIHENDPADFLYVVVDGLVEMFGTHAGRETTLGFVHPMGTFILAAVLKDQVHLQSARTLEPSRLLMIPAESLRSAMHQDSGFMAAVVAELATCYRNLVKELKNQKLRTGVDRLANWLIRAHRLQGGNGTVEIRVEKKVLASRLGMAPENLSRAFAALGPYGVELNGSTIRLHALEELAAFGQPNPLIDDPAT
jgi:CRP/FNR family transcriptional activator FtrB